MSIVFKPYITEENKNTKEMIKKIENRDHYVNQKQMKAVGLKNNGNVCFVNKGCFSYTRW